MKVIVWIVSWLWTIVNAPTNWIFGDNLFDLFMEAIFVLAFVLVCAIPIWIVVAILRKVWRAMGAGPTRFIVTFGEHTTRILDWWRRSSSYKIAFVLTAIMIVPPHLFMSWELREYKTEFKNRAMHSSHTEVFYNSEPGEPGEFDYGGKLDVLVMARTQTLARHQFVPYFTAIWRTNGLIVAVPGAYIYTFMPKNVYDGAVCSVIRRLANDDEKNAKDLCAEYLRFLSEPFPIK